LKNLLEFSFPFTYGLETGLKLMVGFYAVVTKTGKNPCLAHFSYFTFYKSP
jgi:hypothetical protein